MTQDEIYSAEKLLKKESGGNWKEIVQHLRTRELASCAGRNLISFMAFPERKQGSTMSIKNLYEHIEKHPKIKNNQYYKERICACIDEHHSQFQTSGSVSHLACAME